MSQNHCPTCNGTGMLFFTKDAPSPPYKEGMKLDYMVFCKCIPPVKTKNNGVF